MSIDERLDESGLARLEVGVSGRLGRLLRGQRRRRRLRLGRGDSRERRHRGRGRRPRRSRLLTGSALSFLPSPYLLAFSALLASTPGNPIIFQPALSLLPP